MSRVGFNVDRADRWMTEQLQLPRRSPQARPAPSRVDQAARGPLHRRRPLPQPPAGNASAQHEGSHQVERRDHDGAVRGPAAQPEAIGRGDEGQQVHEEGLRIFPSLRLPVQRGQEESGESRVSPSPRSKLIRSTIAHCQVHSIGLYAAHHSPRQSRRGALSHRGQAASTNRRLLEPARSGSSLEHPPSRATLMLIIHATSLVALQHPRSSSRSIGWRQRLLRATLRCWAR